VKKEASSQASWALITHGVLGARLEAHRLKHLLNRALKLVESSNERDHLHQVAGDIIQGLPARLDALEMNLDTTSLALSKMGDTFLQARLPISQKNRVDEAVTPAFGGGSMHRSAVDRLAVRYLKARLEGNHE
jgi:hypothetical protein